jgi:hypothetical protein
MKFLKITITPDMTESELSYALKLARCLVGSITSVSSNDGKFRGIHNGKFIVMRCTNAVYFRDSITLPLDTITVNPWLAFQYGIKCNWKDVKPNGKVDDYGKADFDNLPLHLYEQSMSDIHSWFNECEWSLNYDTISNNEIKGIEVT